MGQLIQGGWMRVLRGPNLMLPWRVSLFHDNRFPQPLFRPYWVTADNFFALCLLHFFRVSGLFLPAHLWVNFWLWNSALNTVFPDRIMWPPVLAISPTNPLLFVCLDPRELCALVLFPTRNFNFVFVPRPAMAPCYVNLSSISHSLSPCFFSLALTLA